MANALAVSTADSEIDDLLPWEQRLDLDESNVAFHGFCHYRDLPPRDRSLRRAYAMHMVECQHSDTISHKLDTQSLTDVHVSAGWKEWTKRFEWKRRAALFDAFNDRQRTEERLQAIRDMDKRHANLSVAFQNRVVERMQTLPLNELGPRDLLAWFNVATQIERRARGMATDIIAHQNMDEASLTSVPSAGVIRRRLKELGILQEVMGEVERDDDDAPPALAPPKDVIEGHVTTVEVVPTPKAPA